MKPLAAALKGAEEIGFTVLTISISLVAVFIPLLFMGGIVGRLFREFAVTLSTAIIVSMVDLADHHADDVRLAAQERARAEARPHLSGQRARLRLGAGQYRRSLHWVLDHPALTIMVLLLTDRLNVLLIIIIPKGFFPQQDTGAITGGVQGPQDASFPAMDDSIQQIVGVIRSDPAVANVIAFTGGNGATNTGLHLHRAQAAQRSAKSAPRRSSAGCARS